MDLPHPKNNIQEILLFLIENEKVSILDFPYLSSFRTRISEFKLKYGLNLFHYNKVGKNKFNNTYVYVEHVLPDKEIQNAKKLYLKLCN